MKRLALFALLVLLALGGMLFLEPLRSPTAAQVIQYNTPTPQEDGKIIYTVREGDTCTGIALKHQITEEQLRSLNLEKLQGNGCVTNLFPGDLLIIAIVPPQPTATEGPSPTPTSMLPSATPFAGTGNVCVLLFNDKNGNSYREVDTESSIPGGAVSLTDRLGKVSFTEETSAGEDPICFEDLPEGEYNITVAVPAGYNPTTVMNYALNLRAGDQSVLDFGAQVNTQPGQPLPGNDPAAGGSRSMVLGILGAVVVLAGIGLAVYAALLGRRR